MDGSCGGFDNPFALGWVITYDQPHFEDLGRKQNLQY